MFDAIFCGYPLLILLYLLSRPAKKNSRKLLVTIKFHLIEWMTGAIA